MYFSKNILRQLPKATAVSKRFTPEWSFDIILPKYLRINICAKYFFVTLSTYVRINEGLFALQMMFGFCGLVDLKIIEIAIYQHFCVVEN